MLSSSIDVICSGKKGHTFECTANVHGTKIPITVEVASDKGDIEWEFKYLTLPSSGAETKIHARPEFADQQVKIECQDEVWVSIPDSEWTCDITELGDGNKNTSQRSSSPTARAPS